MAGRRVGWVLWTMVLGCGSEAPPDPTDEPSAAVTSSPLPSTTEPPAGSPSAPPSEAPTPLGTQTAAPTQPATDPQTPPQTPAGPSPSPTPTTTPGPGETSPPPVATSPTATVAPSATPAPERTSPPSPAPTGVATPAPTPPPPTAAPTPAPTDAPTSAQTLAPTDAPTGSQSPAPTEAPTSAATRAPTPAPTEAPSPTAAPTDGRSPTAAPTSSPTPTGEASCTNGRRDPGEDGLDCGGACPDRCVPADPFEVAPPVARGVVTSVHHSARFLFEGPDLVQFGVDPEDMDPVRLSVVSGRVLDPTGGALAGVEITVGGHPELGYTYSREDGEFDLAVNGGEELRVVIRPEGGVPVQRRVQVPWRGWARVPDVIITPLDPVVTEIDFSEPLGVAVASLTVDEDGARQPVMLFPEDAAPEMILNTQDGELRVPLETLSVRATEYTVGEGGPAAMPGDLPATSGYTYAVELSVDEALEAGATSVEFAAPVVVYLENFLDFPVGGVVPQGYFDASVGVWRGAENGRVIEILALEGELAVLDVTGEGAPSSAGELEELGITDEERLRLAELYPVGQTLWRVAAQHFTPWDYNWPYGPPGDARNPNGRRPRRRADVNNPCPETGSVIECQNQVLGEVLPLFGTPYSLHYQSDRVPGRRSAFAVEVPITPPSVPGSLVSARLTARIAGQEIVQSYSAAPSQTIRLLWNGKDRYGRNVVGPQEAVLHIDWYYRPVYLEPADFRQAFGQYPQGSVLRDTGRALISLRTTHTQTVGAAFISQSLGLGGWSIDVHHIYDPNARALLLGSGERVTAEATFGTRAEIIAGTGEFTYGFSGEGGPATLAHLDGPSGVAVDALGRIYIVDTNARQVLRVEQDGTIGAIAAPPFGPYTTSGDGGPALEAGFNAPEEVALDPMGNVYITDPYEGVIRRVRPDGIIETAVGSPPDQPDRTTPGADPLPVGEVELGRPQGIACDREGNLYIADSQHLKIYRVDLGGELVTVAGTGAYGDSGDGGLATQARFRSLRGLALDLEGNLYVSDEESGKVRKISPDGKIRAFAGSGSPSPLGDGGPATSAGLYYPRHLAVGAEGEVYIEDALNFLIRKVDRQGIVTSAVGGRGFALEVESGTSPLSTPMSILSGLAIHPEGHLIFSDAALRVVRRLHSSLVGYNGRDVFIPSRDGMSLYHFDPDGRHLETLNPLTGHLVRRFEYNPQGLLTHIVEPGGQTTTLQRDDEGLVQSLTAPYGQLTTLGYDAHGWLAEVAPGSLPPTRMSYTQLGLLTEVEHLDGGISAFTWDTEGLLLSDTDPEGGVRTLILEEDTDERLTVALEDPDGLITRYSRESDPVTGALSSTTTFPVGTFSRTTTTPDGVTELVEEDGTVITTRFAPDPRWGMAAPLMAESTRTTPGGRSSTQQLAREQELEYFGQLAGVARQTDTSTLGARTFTLETVPGQISLTTPSGRTLTTLLDPSGRMSARLLGEALDPVEYSYDPEGRLESIHHGDRAMRYTYDEHGWPATTTNALGQVMEYEYDPIGRLISTRFAGGELYEFEYDDAGNRTAVVMPSGAVHTLGYDLLDREIGWAPPGSDVIATRWSPGDRIEEETRASGASILHHYDATGRKLSQQWSGGAVTLDYVSGTSRVAKVQRQVQGHPTQSLAFTSDGPLLLSQTQALGTTSFTFLYDYDEHFNLMSMELLGEEISMDLDADGLPVRWGDFTAERDPEMGALMSYTDGGLVAALSYDEQARYLGGDYDVAGVGYSLTLSYDAAGRISGREEALGGSSPVEEHLTLDPNGQLLQVERGGQVVETYTYDVNGNRTSRRYGQGAAETATFGEDDRILSRGSVTYLYNADGDLVKRGGISFEVGIHGEILGATTSTGKVITYAYDAAGRRVGRTAQGQTTHFLYANPAQPAQVTAIVAPGATTLLHYDEADRLIAFDRGGERFYVFTNQVGTPVAVVDQGGDVRRALTWDAYGVIRSDSNPGFELPLGFAGGLPDLDTGLVRFGLRDYDPEAGRWTAKDPIRFGGAQANLYLYVGNNPVQLRDPMGLVCVGGSFYALIGLGGRVCYTAKDGISVCAEAGVGVGAGVELDPFGETDKTKAYVGADASAAVPFGQVGIGGEISVDPNDCIERELKVYGAVGAGPASVQVGYDFIQGKPEGALGWDPTDTPEQAANKKKKLNKTGKVKGKIQARVAVGGCTGKE